MKTYGARQNDPPGSEEVQGLATARDLAPRRHARYARYARYASSVSGAVTQLPRTQMRLELRLDDERRAARDHEARRSAWSNWRWRWDLNPRRLAPHTLSRRAPSAARTRHRRKLYLSSGKSSSRYSPSRGLPCSWPRSCTRRILPEIVLGSSANSSRRIRLYGASCSRA